MDQGTDAQALGTSREITAPRSKHPFVFSETDTGGQALAANYICTRQSHWLPRLRQDSKVKQSKSGTAISMAWSSYHISGMISPSPGCRRPWFSI